MKREIESAAQWWTTHVKSRLSSAQAEAFQNVLKQELYQKMLGHWYEENPQRGSGYRSILCDDIQTDAVLKRAAMKVAGPMMWQEITKHFPQDVVMFINPGRVSVKQNHTLYSVYNKENEEKEALNKVSASSKSSSSSMAMESSLFGGSNNFQKTNLPGLVKA